MAITGWEQFALDLAQAHGEEFVRDFVRTLTDEQRAEEEVVYASQRQIAAATARLDQAYVDGIGECHMRVDPTVFWHWVRKEGREIWNDRSFLKRFKADNPDVRVLARSPKTMVVRP
jgi:predicted dithiol-disulfide oxidoreductase (DUF899 family)